ncbi:MAG: hypothetical protein H0Z33_12835 [Bacillaceae bacterium]|nr:hypothetical protein [Bacillaceae bacterium]
MSGGEGFTFSDPSLFAEQRRIMEEMGILYRALKHEFEDQVELEMIDPRNSISFVYTLIKVGRRNGLPWKITFRSLTRGFNTIAVFVNGELVAQGRVPKVAEVRERIVSILNGEKEGSGRGH